MKRIIYLLAATVVMFTACENSPMADFSVSDIVVETGEDIHFYNNSFNAYDFEWDFGDGYLAYRENPIHRYTEPGIYEVRLAAFDEDQVDYAYVQIEVLEPLTVLEIEVLEYYDQYPVPEASVILYPTYEDWLNETNMIIEVFTDHNGIAKIEGLEPVNYYLDIWHTNHDNYALAEEDVSFIKVDEMYRGAINHYTAWVDYVSRLKSNKRRSSVKMKDGEPRTYSPNHKLQDKK